ncbi:hypothetical protein CWO91_05100 [Bradyrhizobium genosp. SA-3]|nr:hypothetical protein CWO91_05100 [Bradyrhizobium genosp. SA-3]
MPGERTLVGNLWDAIAIPAVWPLIAQQVGTGSALTHEMRVHALEAKVNTIETFYSLAGTKKPQRLEPRWGVRSK